MELELGDSIPSAIQDAIYSTRVQIAIFTPRYAESSWCLDELLLMLETSALFIPIFCDVKPSDLRYLDKGRYAAAFAQHEEMGRFSNDTIRQWKTALLSSSFVSGYKFSTSHEPSLSIREFSVESVHRSSSYAFPRCVRNKAAPHMEEEGRSIVKKCGNLPLVIKTIAASLANTALTEWEMKRRQLERVITESLTPSW